MAKSLEIIVEADAHVAIKGTPQKLLDSLRRQLRQHEPTKIVEKIKPELLNLLRIKSDRFRLPQGLLSRLAETCQRHGIEYSVVDLRATVPCAPLYSHIVLKDHQADALRQLLLKDSGVLVGENFNDRFAVAIELIARRRQRCLIVVPSVEQIPSTIKHIASALNLKNPSIQTHSKATTDSQVVVASCSEARRLDEAELRHAYGMMIFEGIHETDPVYLLETLRFVGARYLLGLAKTATRQDQLHGPLYLALGGIVHQIKADISQPVPLFYRRRNTNFNFPYNGRAQYQALVAALANDAERNEKIARDIFQEATLGHPCLVLSERRDHLEHLHDLLPPKFSVAQVSSNIRPVERSQIIEQFNTGKITVLLATGQIALDSITTSHVSRLFFCFPFSYSVKLLQLVKSLTQPSPQKIDAIVYDYDDKLVVPLHKTFEKRAKILSRLEKASRKETLRNAQLKLDFG